MHSDNVAGDLLAEAADQFMDAVIGINDEAAIGINYVLISQSFHDLALVTDRIGMLIED
jgi:hypothetical protein